MFFPGFLVCFWKRTYTVYPRLNDFLAWVESSSYGGVFNLLLHIAALSASDVKLIVQLVMFDGIRKHSPQEVNCLNW